MYGGWIVPEKNETQETSNDTYVLLLTNDTGVSGYFVQLLECHWLIAGEYQT